MIMCAARTSLPILPIVVPMPLPSLFLQPLAQSEHLPTAPRLLHRFDSACLLVLDVAREECAGNGNVVIGNVCSCVRLNRPVTRLVVATLFHWTRHSGVQEKQNCGTSGV